VKKLLSWTAVGLWMALIFYLSHQPGTESGELSRGVTAFIIETIQLIAPQLNLETPAFHFFIRKNAHFFAYFMLGWLVMNAWRTQEVFGLRRVVWTVAICFLYAASDETHQLFIPGRSGEVRDVLIDTAGASTGVVIYLVLGWLIGKLIKRSRRHSGSLGIDHKGGGIGE